LAGSPAWAQWAAVFVALASFRRSAGPAASEARNAAELR
jgi:hypothetical protein